MRRRDGGHDRRQQAHPSTAGSSATRSEFLLSREDICVRYPNGGIGVKCASLDIQAGQVVGLFGPNGAGKTTTVRAASGFLRSEGARVISRSVAAAGPGRGDQRYWDSRVSKTRLHRISGMALCSHSRLGGRRR